jgi:glycosyltransferase involved in cell wall biosynthesis
MTARGLGPFLRFWGWRTPEEVRSHLRELDILVLFSKFEGLPLVLLEAMGHGVVPVVTRTESGNAELIRDGENGYLIPIGDIEAFAARLRHLANHPEAFSRLRQASYATARAYSIDRMTSAYLACLSLEDLWAGTKPRAPRPGGNYPLMPSCRSRYPSWMRRLKAQATVSLASIRGDHGY